MPISDEMLNETWYRVISDNGEKMPTYPPGILHCGTINPIWLNGECCVVPQSNGTRNAKEKALSCFWGKRRKNNQPKKLGSTQFLWNYPTQLLSKDNTPYSTNARECTGYLLTFLELKLLFNEKNGTL